MQISAKFKTSLGQGGKSSSAKAVFGEKKRKEKRKREKKKQKTGPLA
jgi:hypothetical protein